MADITVTAANVAEGSDSTTEKGTAGGTVTAGQVLYKDTTDSNKLKLVDNDAAATAKVAGVSLNGAASGQPVVFLTNGNLNPGATAGVTVGEIYCSSSTAGGIAPEGDGASGDYVSILGVATATNNVKIQILNSGVQIPA